MPKVYSRYNQDLPENDINYLYVGEGSPYANPFTVPKDGNRDEVCDKYEAWVEANPHIKNGLKLMFKGKDILCCCAPLRCHGDYILRIANED